MNHRTRNLLIAAAALSLATFAVLPFGAPGWVAGPVAMLFCLLAPGLVAAAWLDLRDGLLTSVVVIATGPAVWTLVATAQAFAGLWAPRATVVIGAGWMLIAIVAAALRARRTPVAPPLPD